MDSEYKLNYSRKKVYESPTYHNQTGSHYVLEDTGYSTLSPSHRNEYVIVLDSGSKALYKTGVKNQQQFIESNEVEYSEKEGFYQQKLMAFEKNFHSEIEEIKVKIMNECKLILENELRSQASIFLIEKTSLERIIKEQQTTIVEYEIKLKTYIHELEELRISFNDREKNITNLNIELTSIRQGEEHTINDLRIHYEEMLKYQEEKFHQELEDQILNIRMSYEITIKSYEKQIEAFEARFAQLNKTIESLNQVILERTQEIDNIQKSTKESEHRYMLHETKLRQEHERIMMSIRRDYDEKIKNFEGKLHTNENYFSELKLSQHTVSRLEEELHEWQKKYVHLEKHKQKEIIKEVVIEKPIDSAVKFEKVKVKDSKKERKWNEEKIQLEKEITNLRQYMSELEFRAQQAQQIVYVKDQELQKTYSSIEELQISIHEINVEIERVKEENVTIMRDREKIIHLINSYRRYLKELEILVSEKNQHLFQKIRELDLVISGEEFVREVNVLPLKTGLYSKTTYQSNNPASEKKTVTKTQNIRTTAYSAQKRT